MLGMVTLGDDGCMKHAKNPNRFMSSSPYMLNERPRLCNGKHAHQHLLAGRATDAENYSLDIVRATLRDMQRTTDATESSRAISEAHWDLVMAMKTTNANTHDADDSNIQRSMVPTTDGTCLPVNFAHGDVKHVHCDEHTGEAIPSHLASAAIEEQLTYVNNVVSEAAKVEYVKGEEAIR